MNNYLSQSNQRTKIKESYSSREQILFGASQESVLGPFLCNIFLSNLSLVLNETDIASYSDGNTLNQAHGNVETFVQTLKMNAEKLFKWFKDNQMKDKAENYHLTLSARDSNQIQIRNSLIRRSVCEKLPGVQFDHKLTFDEHVNDLCK